MSDQRTVLTIGDRRSMNAYRHGLTGQVRHILTQADSSRLRHSLPRHSRIKLAPVGVMEADLVQSVADDHWRLQRAAAMESAIFAQPLPEPADVTAGDPEIDAALGQGRIWLAHGKQLALLSLYEHRIHRRVEKNMAELRGLQSARKAALQQALEEADLLAQMAESKGVTYDPAQDFNAADFVCSTAEFARLLLRMGRLRHAKALGLAPRKPSRMAA